MVRDLSNKSETCSACRVIENGPIVSSFLSLSLSLSLFFFLFDRGKALYIYAVQFNLPATHANVSNKIRVVTGERSMQSVWTNVPVRKYIRPETAINPADANGAVYGSSPSPQTCRFDGNVDVTGVATRVIKITG